MIIVTEGIAYQLEFETYTQYHNTQEVNMRSEYMCIVLLKCIFTVTMII
jgi:hypothetical protein